MKSEELEMNELYTLKSQKTVKDFEGYDYTLLGDYHKYKYLNGETKFDGLL
jgi:hypothetical protein